MFSSTLKITIVLLFLFADVSQVSGSVGKGKRQKKSKKKLLFTTGHMKFN
jgi:hypothetical protein